MQPTIGGGARCAKYLLVIFNLLFLVLGGTILGLGIYTTQRGSIEQLKSFNLSWGLIIVGAFIFLLAFFGCCGANRESRGMLKAYFAFMIIFIAAQITIAVVAWKYSGDLDESLFDSFNSADTDTKNDIQNDLKCCGFWNSTDSTTTDPKNVCHIPQPGYANGCYEDIKHELKHYANIAIGAGSAAAAIELLGLVFSCVLLSSIRRKEDEEALLRDARAYNQLSVVFDGCCWFLCAG
ncbi:hypothetical protein CAOG_04812 [Capsaspora owczarzaki ATCC 30864]|uniref:hypothetical protein n=1 Tax=Capsaspora owczarzaki (strain ATCC 30864) TaxID=595528 RepID=UPI0001FE40CE|nr:hypothetical protein CAOG_04812 [Capsaspora owczarzaki ATCC 30864]|eukprot:XP_004347563.1 hypothetical protein CAOG_04812 [Capsaspora owczarzaki ATCC 30864]